MPESTTVSSPDGSSVEIDSETASEPVKKKRGRPRKNPESTTVAKRTRGQSNKGGGSKRATKKKPSTSTKSDSSGDIPPETPDSPPAGASDTGLEVLPKPATIKRKGNSAARGSRKRFEAVQSLGGSVLSEVYADIQGG